jgi:predicted RNA-binding Zn-ribbon protein involved in translation (DUF1610 family)
MTEEKKAVGVQCPGCGTGIRLNKKPDWYERLVAKAVKRDGKLQADITCPVCGATLSVNL